ncbi:MAG: MBL fold metallo-hydrolase RNA specificity domain-containing protein [Candidatus Micrarchaeota archaeon]
MKIKFFGGAQEVGRVSILLEEEKNNLMLDCGIKLGEKTEYPVIDDDTLKRVENITISHAHLDHCGYLPHVYSKKFKPKIFLTKPTRDLMGILLSDYCRIKGTKERTGFTSKDVNNVLRDARITEYDELFNAGFKTRFYQAGHILGSAITSVERPEGRLVFSGDICMRKTRVLDSCEKNLSAKTLIVESTYGAKEDVLPSHKDSYQKMIKVINETLDKGGHVIIPSFAVGRAQEVLLALDDYMRSGALRPTKIFIEGMIGKAMKIYRHNAIYANDDIKRRILMSEDDPFKSPNFNRSRSKTREDVLKEPSIIVTTSGMLSGGPVLFYLEKLAGNPKNTIIFVGYQAEGTSGRKVLEGGKKIRIGDNEVELKLRVESVKLSGHADFNELLQFIKSFKGLEKVFIMHGDKPDLKEYLEKDYEVIIPKLLEEYSI